MIRGQTEVSSPDQDMMTPAPPAGERVEAVEPGPVRTPGLRRVLIVGTDETAGKVADAIRSSGTTAQEVVGFVGSAESTASGVHPILGSRAEILQVIDKHLVDEVIVSDLWSWHEQFLEEMLSNGHRELQVKVVPGIYEAMIAAPRLSSLDDIPLVHLDRRKGFGPYDLIKPLMDKTVALIGLIATTPVLLAAMAITRLTSKGPAILRQERVTTGGRVFKLYKIRTMVDSAEAETGPVLSSENDDRITPFGRLLRATKIDELPQLANVLRGDMSLIGPRPERPCFVEQFQQRMPWYKERHRVPAGITGLAQVYGDYLTPPETKLRYDLMYACNRSLWLDALIMILTVKSVYDEVRRTLTNRAE